VNILSYDRLDNCNFIFKRAAQKLINCSDFVLNIASSKTQCSPILIKISPHLHIVHAHYVSTVVHVLLQVLILQGEMTPSDRKKTK